MESKKDISILSQKLAGKLMVLGYVLQDMKKNNNESGKNVFFFRNSDAIKKDIERLKSEL